MLVYRFSLKRTLYLVLVQQPLVHDVVEVREKVCVWRNILPPLHDPADQLVGMKLPLLVTLRQHGGLEKNEQTNKISYTCEQQLKTGCSYRVLQRSYSHVLVTPTLKSHGVRILSGGMRTGGGGDDWLSREMPKLSLI